jgi:hypothetical protein
MVNVNGKYERLLIIYNNFIILLFFELLSLCLYYLCLMHIIQSHSHTMVYTKVFVVDLKHHANH